MYDVRITNGDKDGNGNGNVLGMGFSGERSRDWSACSTELNEVQNPATTRTHAWGRVHKRMGHHHSRRWGWEGKLNESGSPWVGGIHSQTDCLISLGRPLNETRPFPARPRPRVATPAVRCVRTRATCARGGIFRLFRLLLMFQFLWRKNWRAKTRRATAPSTPLRRAPHLRNAVA